MNVIAKAIDCYSPLTASQCKTLKEASYSAVIRYLGYETHKWSKAITKAELETITSAELKASFAWEGLGQQMKRGFQGGLLDGAQALIEAQALGLSSDVAIYFACDYDAQPSDYETISVYMYGVRKSLNGHYLDGLYAGENVLNNIKASRYWQTCAWSYNGVSNRACMYQSKVNTQVSGISVDVNEIYSDPGWWPVTQNVAPVPMKVYVQDKPLKAIGINDKTYVIWTALNVLGTPYKELNTSGLFEINGKQVQGVVYNDETYFLWAELASSLKSEKLWSFTK